MASKQINPQEPFCDAAEAPSDFPSETAALLLPWYETEKRALPWRADKDPYRIWVSEIMLQQTRVDTVRRYFDRFMARLPTIAALAETEESTLFKLWEGLGYYRRARHLQAGARVVMEQYGGRVPADYAALLALPGVGRYTAGAIASIAFDIQAPAVDGNVLRVAARLTNDSGDVLSSSVHARIEAKVGAAVPPRAGDFNQALIELGATVCLPGAAADCPRCPLRLLCRAAAEGADRVAALPVRLQRTKVRIEQRTVLIVADLRGRVAVRLRPNEGLLAGLYEFPQTEGFLDANRVCALLPPGLAQVGDVVPLPSAQHRFSHVHWRMQGYALRVRAGASFDEGGSWRFATLQELASSYAVPSAFSAYRSWLMSEGGQAWMDSKEL